MKTKRNYIVQVHQLWGWVQSGNKNAAGVYTKESAERRARYWQNKSCSCGLKYRAKEIK